MSRDTPARFDASVLRQHDPIAAMPMRVVLAMLHEPVDAADDEQALFDAAVAKVQPTFYMELVDRAIDACVRHTQYTPMNDEHAQGMMRRMTCLLRALHIDDDPDVWYYISCGLFASTLTVAAALARAVNVLDAPTTIVRFVDRVSRLLLDGVFRACMRNPERCMQRLAWRSLLATVEAQLVRDVSIGAAAVDQLAYRPRAVPSLRVGDLLELNELIHDIDGMDVHLAEAWNAPFVRQAASNARDALHAQNVLGLPGRNSSERARLPAGVATHLARFLAPASIPATDLTRQQAAYLLSVERARAHAPTRPSAVDADVDPNPYRSAERPRDTLSLRALEQAYAHQQARDRAYAAAVAARNDDQ